MALDIDREKLVSGGPQTECLMSMGLGRENQRPFYPCDVYHLLGSVVDKDPRLQDVDVVVGIEV